MSKQTITVDFDSLIEPITVMNLAAHGDDDDDEDEAMTQTIGRKDGKKLALARALAKKEAGEILSNKDKRALARQTNVLTEQGSAKNEEKEISNISAKEQEMTNKLFFLCVIFN